MILYFGAAWAKALLQRGPGSANGMLGIPTWAWSTVTIAVVAGAVLAPSVWLSALRREGLLRRPARSKALEWPYWCGWLGLLLSPLIGGALSVCLSVPLVLWLAGGPELV